MGISEKNLSKEEYRILVEQAPIMIWRANTTTECDYFNDVWLSFTGRTLEEEVGNGWAEGVHKDDFDRCLEIYLTSFDKREIFEMEYRLLRHDGEYRWIFDRGVPFYNGDGSFGGYIGSCIDINEQVLASESLLKEKDDEIMTLSDLVPICMHCKNTRDDRGYWERVESFVSKKTKFKFSHGICPDCAEKYYGGIS